MNGHDLDNWITGHYGEDQYRHQDNREEVLADDEGLQLLEHADSYLRASYRDDDGVDAARDELTGRIGLIEQSYECRHCGNWLGEKNSYCNPDCYKADML